MPPDYVRHIESDGAVKALESGENQIFGPEIILLLRSALFSSLGVASMPGKLAVGEASFAIQQDAYSGLIKTVS